MLDIGELMDLLRGFFDRMGALADDWTLESWGVAMQAQMNLWLEGAVSYVGERFWGAVGQQMESVLAQIVSVNDVTRILSEIPGAWTYENPVVWILWAQMTGVFLAFLWPHVSISLTAFLRRRRKGAVWADFFDELFNATLGVGAALLSPLLCVFGILVVNIITALVNQDSTVLPGLPRFTNADEAARNAGLLTVYAALAFALLLERFLAVAAAIVCLVFSGWGLGSMFWPRFDAWHRLWKALATGALVSQVVQAVLMRAGGETINRALGTAPTREALFVGMVLGLAVMVFALLVPAIIGGAMAVGTVMRMVNRVASPLGLSPAGMVAGAVTRSVAGGSLLGGASPVGGMRPPSTPAAPVPWMPWTASWRP